MSYRRISSMLSTCIFAILSPSVSPIPRPFTSSSLLTAPSWLFCRKRKFEPVYPSHISMSRACVCVYGFPFYARECVLVACVWPMYACLYVGLWLVHGCLRVRMDNDVCLYFCLYVCVWLLYVCLCVCLWRCICPSVSGVLCLLKCLWLRLWPSAWGSRVSASVSQWG